MDVEYIAFTTRADRARYVAERFRPCLTGRVLDVGCDEAVLRDLLPGVRYTGVDIGGKPDIPLDLEKTARLPFDDRAFDGVVCTDVLEHIENLHAMFEELVRVSAKHLVLSLPNCWVGARRPIGRGRGSFAHYGLPDEKPMDRHKWFFNLTDAEQFVRVQAERLGLGIRELFATEKPRSTATRLLRRLRYPGQADYLNRYAHTLWVRFERPGF